MRTKPAFTWGALCTLLAASGVAADPHQEARAAYDRGAAAYDAGDYAGAAAEFARADQLAPDETTLDVGLDAALRADDPALGMTLADRAEGRGVRRNALAKVSALRAKFAERAGRLSVTCPPPKSCAAKLDAVPIPMHEARWVTVGVHAVELVVDGRVEEHAIRVTPRNTLEVTPFAAPPPAAPDARAPAAADKGLSPVWFWAGVGISAALGGATAASAVDTANKHAAYLGAPTENGSTEGMAAQTRTNVLFGVTLASAVLTGVVGLFVTRWTNRLPAHVTAGLAASPAGAGASLAGAY